jgi:hypothetical protein
MHSIQPGSQKRVVQRMENHLLGRVVRKAGRVPRGKEKARAKEDRKEIGTLGTLPRRSPKEREKGMEKVGKEMALEGRREEKQGASPPPECN